VELDREGKHGLVTGFATWIRLAAPARKLLGGARLVASSTPTWSLSSHPPLSLNGSVYRIHGGLVCNVL
jgi:hypothetical protein